MKQLLITSALLASCFTFACATIVDENGETGGPSLPTGGNSGMGGVVTGSGGSSSGSGGGLIGSSGGTTSASGGSSASGGTTSASGGTTGGGSCSNCQAWASFDYNTKPADGACVTGADGNNYVYNVGGGQFNTGCGPGPDDRQSWCGDNEGIFTSCQ